MAQIHQWFSDHHQPFANTVLGVSRFANARALFDRARDTGTRWCSDEALQTPANWAQAQADLAHDRDGQTARVGAWLLARVAGWPG